MNKKVLLARLRMVDNILNYYCDTEPDRFTYLCEQLKREETRLWHYIEVLDDSSDVASFLVQIKRLEHKVVNLIFAKHRQYTT